MINIMLIFYALCCFAYTGIAPFELNRGIVIMFLAMPEILIEVFICWFIVELVKKQEEQSDE